LKRAANRPLQKGRRLAAFLLFEVIVLAGSVATDDLVAMRE
jgi:hypothetical protein